MELKKVFLFFASVEGQVRGRKRRAGGPRSGPPSSKRDPRKRRRRTRGPREGAEPAGINGWAMVAVEGEGEGEVAEVEAEEAVEGAEAGMGEDGEEVEAAAAEEAEAEEAAAAAVVEEEEEEEGAEEGEEGDREETIKNTAKSTTTNSSSSSSSSNSNSNSNNNTSSSATAKVLPQNLDLLLLLQSSTLLLSRPFPRGHSSCLTNPFPATYLLGSRNLPLPRRGIKMRWMEAEAKRCSPLSTSAQSSNLRKDREDHRPIR